MAQASPSIEPSEASQPMLTDLLSYRPLLKVFLEGLYDDECSLSKLRGFYFILKAIWSDVKHYYQKGIIECGCGSGLVQECQCATCRSAPYPKFPAPMPMGGVNVTMLPFICGIEFEDYRLPEYVKQYEDLIKFCLQHQMKRNASFLGKVCYLTIWERDLSPGEFLGQDCMQTQAGLSVNFPGSMGPKWKCSKYLEYKGIKWINSGGVYLMSEFSRINKSLEM